MQRLLTKNTFRFVHILCIFSLASSLRRISTLGWKSAASSSSIKQQIFLPSTRFMNTMGSGPSSIKPMSVVEFGKILDSPNRSLYQIVDVREKDELRDVALQGDDVINLPMSQMNDWSAKVEKGELLDPSKPIICMCKLGGRSYRAATYFATQAGFAQVYNMEGGITAYAAQAGASVVKRH